MDQEGFLKAERRLQQNRNRLVRPQNDNNADLNVKDREELYGMRDVGNQQDVIQEGAGDVQDSGGSAGSGLQSGLGHGMATENEEEVVQESEDGDDDEEVEEGRKGRGMPSPLTVSKKERDEHELTHLPYRSWCAHCVRGRGRSMAHKQLEAQDRETIVPRVSLDYFFLTNRDGDKNKKVKEEEEKHLHPMLVMKDETTGERYARMVEHKGLHEGDESAWVVSDIIAELRSWGHQGGEAGHLIIKCDGENAILTVIEEVAKRLGGKVITEKPAKGESQSNGVIEEAGKTMREMAKVIRDAVEFKKS